jgi:tetrahydromethanopterin S-methyltransferase subunit H
VFKFEKEQYVSDIAGVKVGGQPGEYPTVLVPSIFYDGHKIVKDPVNGEFDRQRAEILVNKLIELSEKTGNPFFLDVVGNTSEALIRYVDFISNLTQSPFLVDGPSEQVRIPAMEQIKEMGLMSRAIYNSIDYHATDRELNSLRDLGVQNAIVMAFDPKKPLAEGRASILKGYSGQRGLMNAAEMAGIKNVLVDTGVLDVPSIGIAARAVQLVKNEFGLPTGCAPANAVTGWKRVKKGEFGSVAYNVCLGGSVVVTQMSGANFVLHGPIEFAEAAFPACAMTDAIIAYAAKRLGTTTKTQNHPLYKIF